MSALKNSSIRCSAMLVGSASQLAKYHKYIMKYLRRTDKKYLPLQRLVNPQVIANADFYRDSNYSGSFSREIEKSFDFEDAMKTSKYVQKGSTKKPSQTLKMINCSLEVTQ
jgi:hypothetical protein